MSYVGWKMEEMGCVRRVFLSLAWLLMFSIGCMKESLRGTLRNRWITCAGLDLVRPPRFLSHVN